MDYNIEYTYSVEIRTEVMKGIKNGVGTLNDCAPLVVVSGGMPFASEYEGQVSSWLPVGSAGQQPVMFGALPFAASSPQPFHSLHETDA